MAKIESSFKNMLVALLAVTFIASASLGLVNELTKDAIKESNINKQNQAIAEVINDFGSISESYKIMPTSGSDSLEIFTAVTNDGKDAGIAVKSYTTSGFSGLISVMVGFDRNKTISGFKVLAHNETPGLGSKMQDWFSNTEKPGQYIVGRSIKNDGLKVSKDGGEIDAITAATISSRAFLDAVNRAYSALGQIDASTGASNKNYKNEGGN